MGHGQNVKHYTTQQRVLIQLHRINYDYNVKLLTLTVVQHKRSLTRVSGLAHAGDKGHVVGNFTGTMGGCGGAKQRRQTQRLPQRANPQ